MRDLNSGSRQGSSPVKIALAAMLTVIFIIVLVFQFGGATDADDSEDGELRADRKTDRDTRRPRGPRRPGGPRIATIPRKTTADQTPARPWPVVDPSRVLKHDPFSLSAIFSRPKQEDNDPGLQEEQPPEPSAGLAELQRQQAAQRDAIAQLQQQGVNAILQGDTTEGVALLGSKVVRVGDEINGHRVIAIRRNGVVLQPPIVAPPPADGSTK